MRKIHNLLLFLALAGMSLILLTTRHYLLAVVPVLAIPVLFVFFKHPVVAYYIIIFFIPFSAYRGLTESYDFLTVSKLAGAILVMVVAFHFLFRKGEPIPLGSKFWKWFAAFGVVNLVAALVSPFFPLSLDELRGLLTAYIVFAMTLLFIDRQRYEHGLVSVLVASVTISSLLSIVGYVFNVEMFAMDVTATSLKRATGTAGNPNHFACMVIFVIPLILHRVFFATTALARLVNIALFMVNVLAVAFTFSRSGAVVLGLVLLLSGLRLATRLQPRQLGVAGACLLVVAAVILGSIPPEYWQRQMSIGHAADHSITRRMSYLDVAWDVFRQAPLFGQGPGMFNLIYARSEQALAHGGATDVGRDAHNTYVEIGTGAGILGIVIFLAIIGRCLANFLAASRRFTDQGDAAMASLTRASLVSFVSLLAYFFMLSSMTHKYFWMSLGLSQVAVGLASKTPVPDESRRG